MDVKGALTRKFGPLPAWAWLLLFAGVVYYYRKYRSNVANIATTGTASDLTPPTPQDPLVLQPGESVYDPNTGQLLGGSGAPGGSGAGFGGSFGGDAVPPDSGTATAPSDTGGGGADGTGGGGRSGGGRTVKPVKLNVKGLARAGSALAGAKRLSKPRSNTHTRTAARPAAQQGGPNFSLLEKGRPRKSVKPTQHKAVRPPTTHIKTRSGRTRPMVHRTENQRPAAKGPAAPRRQASAPPPHPPRRTAPHNPGRTPRQAGSPPRKPSRPRGKKR